MEEWQQAGIWIVTRGDDFYPKRIHNHLGHQRPPILFGIGKFSILHKGGLGIVGSRHVDQKGTIFTEHVAELCALEDIPVVSGGATGVDSIAMLGCNIRGGSAVGFLADGLLKKSLSTKFRDHIASGHLVLLSPYHPKVGFSVGNAMGRNKLIYAQANHTLIISADFQKGGTWAGAIDELKRTNHRTIFVRDEKDIPQGNRELIKLGGIAFPNISDKEDFKSRLLHDYNNKNTNKNNHCTCIQESLI